MRILLCSPDQFVTQIIEEFQYSWPYSNPHNICGICAAWMVEFDQLSGRSYRVHFDTVILRIFWCIAKPLFDKKNITNRHRHLQQYTRSNTVHVL